MIAKHLLPLCLLLAAAPLSAQAVHVVDINNGPGADFVSVAAAVAASTEGDAILVREGSLVLQTGVEALPRTLPQIFFAALMLAVGVAAGRVSRGGVDSGSYDASYQHGDGI